MAPSASDPSVVDLASIDLTDLDAFAAGPPHHWYQQLRDHAPVFWHPPTRHTPGGEGFWCLTRHGDVEWAAKQADVFSSATGGDRGGAGGTLIEDLPPEFAAGVLFNMQDDPRHHRIRQLVTPPVTPKALRALEPDLRARARAIVDAAVARGECDFLVEVAAELPLQAIAALLGVPQEDRHRFMAWADTTLDYDDRALGEVSARTQQASAEMFAYGQELLAAKRACPLDDMLSIVARAELPADAAPGGPMTDLEQQMFFNLLIAAGSETTRNSITAGLLGLMADPGQWEQLRADRSGLPNAVEEMLRYASSTIYNRRTATRDVERHGVTIRRGDKVVLWWQAANFDERVFTDPLRFDITRAPNPHLAFGTGSHFCLGANLARLEIAVIFEALLDQVAAVEPTGPVVLTRSNKHAGYRHAPVRLHPV